MRDGSLFTKREAERKVGMKVQSLVEFSGVSKGTTGIVIHADLMGAVESRDGVMVEEYDLAVQWDFPSAPRMIVNCGTFTFIRPSKPLVDWFTKDEYERFLTEL